MNWKWLGSSLRLTFSVTGRAGPIKVGPMRPLAVLSGNVRAESDEEYHESSGLEVLGLGGSYDCCGDKLPAPRR